MPFKARLGDAIGASGLHFLGSVVGAVGAALVVFLVWYPYPFGELAGGRELFLLIVSVDVVCGPLLTMVIFNRAKPRAKLVLDLGLVVLIQLTALTYGLWTVWQARPLFLVQEVDRFKVIAAPDVDGAALAALPSALKPTIFSGPVTLAIRAPKDAQERNNVLFESVAGGRDYAERPEFYIAYEGAAALKTLRRTKPLAVFLEKHPDQREAASKIALEKGGDLAQYLYMPVTGRQDWVAVLDKQAQIQGFLRGDGFADRLQPSIAP